MALTEKDSLCDVDIVSQKWSIAKKMPILKAFILANHFCPQILSNSPNR
jgi:hypothetical protein